MNTTQPENNKPVLRIFFSYAIADRAKALKVHRLLSRLNLRIFTKDTLSAGEDWQSKLKDELTQCDLFIGQSP